MVDLGVGGFQTTPSSPPARVWYHGAQIRGIYPPDIYASLVGFDIEMPSVVVNTCGIYLQTLCAGQKRCRCALVLPERIVNIPHLSAAGCSRIRRQRRPGWWFENRWKKGTKPNCREAKHEMRDPYRMSARIYVHHLYSGTDPQEEIGRERGLDARETLNHEHRTIEMTPDQAVHPIATP